MYASARLTGTSKVPLTALSSLREGKLAEFPTDASGRRIELDELTYKHKTKL